MDFRPSVSLYYFIQWHQACTILQIQKLIRSNFLPVLAQIDQCCQEAQSAMDLYISISFSSRYAEEASVVSKTAMSTVSTGHFLVPVSKNPHFSGHNEELQLLEKYLKLVDHTPCSDYPVVAVHGLGGVGYAISSLNIQYLLSLIHNVSRMAQLVTQYASRHRKNHPYASIFWVTLSQQRVNTRLTHNSVRWTKVS